MIIEYILVALVVFMAPIPWWQILFHSSIIKDWRVFPTLIYLSISLMWLVLGYFAFTNIGLFFSWTFESGWVFWVLGGVILLAVVYLDWQIMGVLGLKRLICIAEMERKGKLVVSGIYKYARHPRYVEYSLLFLGLGLVFGNWFLILFSVYVFLSFWIETYFEEKELINRFGSSYKKYKKKVPKFFIRL